ncbi:hypothetical protein Pcinc_039997 [Petrolisthes cinctipes]|uniref:Uncharacterized protein n=1 Tax=Petrolisthes cinctipes TaxID=88211 RepID=A0AAE1BQ24_PETCI|nr:hypothetical protein Pcinc_039997 [Petrolisthes cinctipes]
MHTIGRAEVLGVVVRRRGRRRGRKRRKGLVVVVVVVVERRHCENGGGGFGKEKTRGCELGGDAGKGVDEFDRGVGDVVVYAWEEILVRYALAAGRKAKETPGPNPVFRNTRKKKPLLSVPRLRRAGQTSWCVTLHHNPSQGHEHRWCGDSLGFERVGDGGGRRAAVLTPSNC